MEPLRTVFLVATAAASIPTAAATEEPIATLVGESADGYFGQSTALLGDIDGDGTPDFLVGAYRDLGAPDVADQGTVRVFSGATFTLIDSLYGITNDRYGWALAATGDVDGDGVSDFAVGATQRDQGNNPGGYAELRSGGDRALVYRWWGDQEDDEFGCDVDGAGDVNGDGALDVIVGGRFADPGGVSESGVVRLFSGQDGALLRQISSGTAADWTGWSVAGVGDVDQDGFDDVLIGLPGADSCCFAGAGRAEVRSGATGGVLRTHEGVASNDAAAREVADVGDLDGDGRRDYAVDGKYDDVTWQLTGAARIYSGLDGALMHAWVGAAPFDNFGRAIAAAGDVDGDGRGDVVIGSPAADTTWSAAGRVEVRSGLDGSVLLLRNGIDDADYLGTSVAGGVDVNLDGRPDVLAGATQSLDDPGYAELLSPTCGEISTYGAGCAGSGGVSPTLAVTGCATSLATMRLDVAGGLGGFPALLLLGSGAGDVPIGGGCSLLVAPLSPITAPFVLAGWGPGQGSAHFETTVPLGVSATSIRLQVASGDPSLPHGFVLTNGVAIAID